MAFFVFLGVDRAGMAATRARIREEHRAYLRARHADCRFVSGGPMLDAPGGAMAGSLLIFEAASRGAVERMMADEPYTRAALFARRELHPFDWTVGAPDSS